jgi:hypothetical protein
MDANHLGSAIGFTDQQGNSVLFMGFLRAAFAPDARF